MNRNVLILNGGIPYQIRPWQEEIENIFLGKSLVLEEYKDFPLHNCKREEIMKCPSVVMLKDYIKHNHEPRYSKTLVFYRDLYHCQYCGTYINKERHREIDHVIPKSSPKYPGTNFNNVVLSCTKCNKQKANKTLDEMINEKCWNGKQFKLLKQPTVPQVGNEFSRFVIMINQSNIMWLKYIPKFEYYAKKLGKDWLIDSYKELGPA